MDVRFTPSAYKDYLFWKKSDPKIVDRIKRLCEDISAHPHSGIGKPEPLKFDLQGCWSWRINKEHRLVYNVDKEGILIISCRYHY